jgi:hypothetical protein
MLGKDQSVLCHARRELTNALSSDTCPARKAHTDWLEYMGRVRPLGKRARG